MSLFKITNSLIDGHLDSMHFWLLQIMLFGMFAFKCLCGLIYSVLSVIYLGTESLDYCVTVFNFLRNCQTVFEMTASCYIPFSIAGEFRCLHLYYCMLVSIFLLLAILVAVKWYLIMVQICICLMMKYINHLFMSLFSHLCSHLRKHLLKCFTHFLI